MLFPLVFHSFLGKLVISQPCKVPSVAKERSAKCLLYSAGASTRAIYCRVDLAPQ